jgi:hypothetical protein
MYAVPLGVRAAPHFSHTLFSSSAIFFYAPSKARKPLPKPVPLTRLSGLRGIRENKHENDTRPESMNCVLEGFISLASVIPGEFPLPRA